MKLKKFFKEWMRFIILITLIFSGGIISGTGIFKESIFMIVIGFICGTIGEILLVLDFDKKCPDSYWW